MISRSTLKTTLDDEKYLTPLSRQICYYIAEITIETPPQTVYLVVDTGSGLIWTQCLPCITCFPQQDPIYDPRASSTYHRVPCEHPLCPYETPLSNFQCVNEECVYAAYYANNAIGPSRGYLSLDSFQFLTDSDDNTELFNIVFGCSNDNTNFRNFNVPGNKIAGILGLNLAPEGLFDQLYDDIGGTFSYCIPRLDRNYARHHVIRFGDDVVIPDENIPTTHYFTFEFLYYFYVLCTDISIGFYHLGLPSGTFDGGLRGGLILDSGAPVTVLTTEAMNGVNVYRQVITALTQYYDYHQLQRVPQNQNPTPFELCYWKRPGFRDFPSMTYHLEGADYTVDGSYMNMEYLGERFFCVGMIGSPGNTIIGANHMQNKRIIYNGDIGAIQFYNVDCNRDEF